jgi:SAM-dependent methyltransferase
MNTRSKPSSAEAFLAGARSPSFLNLAPKVRESIKRRGVLATLKLAVSWPLRRFQIDRFDRMHAVNTSGTVGLKNLGINSPNVIHGIDYRATPPWVFRRMLRQLKIRYEDWVFVDLGSGKGRSLLLASEFAFNKIIGVEFSAELNSVAQENIRNFRSGKQKCKTVESVCMDAVIYPLPLQNTILYFYFPFREPIMEKVLGNIHSSLAAHPREFRIINYDPTPGNLFQRDPTLKVIKRNSTYVIYKIKKARGAF